MTAKEIRELTDLPRVRFCEKYGIPLRTMENWEAGARQAPQYILDLLERAVREDFGIKTE
jgi:putative transcriptional regulator